MVNQPKPTVHTLHASVLVDFAAFTIAAMFTHAVSNVIDTMFILP